MRWTVFAAIFLTACGVTASPKEDYSSLQARYDELFLEKEMFKEESLQYYDKFKNVQQLLNVLQTTLSLEKNPSGMSDYDYSYAACGEKWTGNRTGCELTVFCSTSMTPLFSCEEKLLFTTKKLGNIEVGDIVDVKLTNPINVSIDGEDFEYSHFVHVVRRIEDDRLFTGRLNPSSALYSKDEFLDDFEVRKSDVLGTLSGVIW